MRHREYLVGRYQAIAACLGLVMAFTGAAMWTPLLGLPWAEDELCHAPAFALPGLALVASGWFVWRRLGHRLGTPSAAEGGVVVVVGWAAASLVSAVPLAWTEGMGPTRAIFEAVSGWTTTGLSVLDVTQATRLTLLWRSIMQLVGGAGLAIVMLAAMSRFSGAALGAAEGRGNQLVPSVSDSAQLVLRIYSGYAVAGVLAYRAVGLSWFDALNHAFAAVSTGGFSTRPESIGAWDSLAVEVVSLVLMVLGNLSFVTAWLALRGRFGAVARDGEVRLMALVLPVSATLLFACTTAAMYAESAKGVRVAVFEAVSALTTTGFSTVAYGDWGPAGVFVLLVLMVIGGGTCSTAGGLKQFRVVILARALALTLGRARRPERAVTFATVPFGGERVAVTEAVVAGVALFGALYSATWALGTLVLACHGYSLRDAAFEFASSLGTVGLSIGVTTPTTPPIVLWTQTAAMFLGRLELLVVILAVDKVLRDAAVLARRGAARTHDTATT